MKTLKVKNSEDVKIHYANWFKTAVDLMKPTNLFVDGGRGLAKTTDILANRMVDVVEDMPRSALLITSDTYMNLMTNVIPNIIMGWEERCDFYEGHHFVVDKAPPPQWERPLYVKTLQYKHTISVYNGVKFFLTSLDRPSANAGLSVQHVFGDEAKYLKEAKLNKLFPTLRGPVDFFGHSPFFLGKTFLSDLANPNIGEDPWMGKQAENVDPKQLLQCLQCGKIVNDIWIEYLAAEQHGATDREKRNVMKRLLRWEERYRKVRMYREVDYEDGTRGVRRTGSTFYYNVSSFANVDILTLEYFENLLKTLDFEEFKTAVLGISQKLEKGSMFYGRMKESHFYHDGNDYDFYDKYGLLDNVNESSLGLRHIRHDEPLEAGFDGGKMCSLVIGQDQGAVLRALKDFHTLPPFWLPELAKKFLEFFKHHKHKVLYLYHDRATNQYRSVGQDQASKLKGYIEKQDDGTGKLVSTGWVVQLMNVGQGNVTHTQEYDLVNVMLSETDNRFPKLQIDLYNCKTLKSSMEHAPLTTDSRGNIKKDKKSEKLPAHRLPMESTNMSDAFKYWVCRMRWLKMLKGKPVIVATGEPKIY